MQSTFKLNKRINSIDDIQTIICNDQGFIGCKGFFFDEFVKTKDLTKCHYGTLVDIDIKDSDDHCFKARDENGNDLIGYYRFFIPEKLLQPIKKKYRPFTGIEFAEKFNLKLNSIIHLRGVPTDDHYCYNYKVVFTGYRWCDDAFQVFLNGSWLDLSKLLELYEYEENGEWHKLGVEE